MCRLRRLLSFPSPTRVPDAGGAFCQPWRCEARADVVKVTAPVTVQPGDHISIIGNTLADRMQHDGWLETYLDSRFPKHELVIRNLGFSGDELTLRLRSADFGTPDQWLTANQGRRRLRLLRLQRVVRGQGRDSPSSRRTSTAFIKHTLAQKLQRQVGARGSSSFRRSPTRTRTAANLPDGGRHNKRLALYTAAMAEVARAERRPLRGPVPADPVRPTTTRRRKSVDDQRHPPDRARQRAARRRSSIRPSSAESPSRAATRSAREAPPGGPRQELHLVQPLPDRRRLLDLRRPRRPASSSAARPTAWSPSARWKSST